MVQWLEKWQIHNPATLRSQMPGSLSEAQMSEQQWILTHLCKYNVYKMFYFRVCRLLLFTPHSYACFSAVCVQLLSSFHSFFRPPFASLFPLAVCPRGRQWGCLITLSFSTHTLVYAHTCTLAQLRPEGCLSLMETNGEITQTAVLNNSLHSVLSGSMP